MSIVVVLYCLYCAHLFMSFVMANATKPNNLQWFVIIVVMTVQFCGFAAIFAFYWFNQPFVSQGVINYTSRTILYWIQSSAYFVFRRHPFAAMRQFLPLAV